MTITITGANIIAGADSALGERSISSQSPNDESSVVDIRFAVATPGEISAAVDAAFAVADAMDASAPTRASRLRVVADALESDAGAVVALAIAETALAEPRLSGELARTVGQLRSYADAVDAGFDLEVTTTPADAASGRPDIVRSTVAIGPVAVFGAGNFPLAFGVLGTDTASALAAGCPVIVKGHPSHPATSERTVRVALEALEGVGPPGALSLLHGGAETGRALVVHPGISAVAFTGSFEGGRSLLEATHTREVPIPVFAEMGSVNPIVVTHEAASARGAEIAAQLAAAITGSAGQLCTKPGVLFVPTGAAGSGLVDELAERMAGSGPFTLLDRRVGERLERRRAELAALPWMHVRTDSERGSTLFELEHADPTMLEALAEEAFGPVAVVVRYGSIDEVVAALPSLAGQLTVGVYGEPGDVDLVGPVLSVARRHAGRLIWNGVPTGVAVVESMHHGGPWPASSAALGSVGHESIRRFRRPLALQGFPIAMIDGLVRRVVS